jgi:N-acetylneuraminate synthase
MHSITINGKAIGPGRPVYIVAEMSGNHNHDFDKAVRIVRAAKEAGANAVKLQTYTPDTMTIDSDREGFIIGKGTLWEGQKLFDLYDTAHTPWDWQPKLKEVADEIGIDLFSTPFDNTAVGFLETMDVPAYKVASFELVDIPLLKRIGETRKPVIMSIGMATLAEIDEAVLTLRQAGAKEIAILKCTSAYPAPPEEMNLRTIPHIAEAFGVVSGLSDHTLGMAVPVAAVALGACIVEKHFKLSKEDCGPDAAFSLDFDEFKTMVENVRLAEKALGEVHYRLTPEEKESTVFRRSLFVVKNVREGEVFTGENVRSIRPGSGLAPKYYDVVLGRRASRDIERGTPLEWEHLGR